MDLVLSICDDLLLDKVWAVLLPASAFASSPSASFIQAAVNSSSYVPIVASQSKWSNLISYIPHPPLPIEQLASPASPSSSLVSAWPRNYVPRQVLSLLVLTLIGIHFLYFSFAWLSYKFFFNHEMMKHPRFLKNQVKMEIQTSLKAFPAMTLLTLPWFQGEVMGYSLLYDNVADYGWPYFFFSIIWYA